ncbi:MAG: hypothetical protein JO085_00690 [Acidimicrobiia bacterium]|nr:hypothetical protein [Acidimicrobiia bacterium]
MRASRARAIANAIAIAIALGSLTACGSAAPAPPKPLAAPAKIEDITGIWRSIHQDVLELRSNGTFVLVTGQALAGNYTLSQASITFFDTKGCGDAQGTYRVQVSLKTRLELSQPDDACGSRKLALADPLIYDQPDFS